MKMVKLCIYRANSFKWHPRIDSGASRCFLINFIYVATQKGKQFGWIVLSTAVARICIESKVVCLFVSLHLILTLIQLVRFKADCP